MSASSTSLHLMMRRTPTPGRERSLPRTAVDSHSLLAYRPTEAVDFSLRSVLPGREIQIWVRFLFEICPTWV
eukprot:70838-Prorocentrum_minimum.AAC.1